MQFEFLTPVREELKEIAAGSERFDIGRGIRFDGVPSEGDLVLLTVGGESEFDGVRREFYRLKKGDWQRNLYDLGHLSPGFSTEDTYYAFRQIQETLLKKKSILMILADKAELAYWQYRAFDDLLPTVNLTIADHAFRVGDESGPLSGKNYLSRIITDEPHKLFECTHLGSQSYFVAREELDLMEALNFNVMRLGWLTEEISECEPELRSSDMFVLNLSSMQASDFQSVSNLSPNGFNSREICSLARYAGINNKMKSFGVYNYEAKNILPDDLLLAEMLWYFTEGKNRASEIPEFDQDGRFEVYYVEIPEQELVFYRDLKTGQWWLSLEGREMEAGEKRNIVPCSVKDYRASLEGKIPDRWWRSYKKLY